jgi:hydrogenase-4 component B
LIGGLALACFVKVYGAVFLGLPRSREAELARESGAAILVPMAVLAACCAVIGIAPLLIAPALDAAARSWASEVETAGPQLAKLAPLGWLSVTGASLLAAFGLGAFLLRRRGRAREAAPGTWDCGYAQPTHAMQYTASSFGAMIIKMFERVLLPRVAPPIVKGIFPPPAAFHSDLPDTVLDRGLVPSFRVVGRVCSWFRLLQRGKINAYLLYIFVTLLVLLLVG